MTKRKNTTIRIGLTALALTLNAAVACAGQNPFPGLDPNTVRRLDPNGLSLPIGEPPDSAAEAVYAKEGAEIVPWAREAVLPSPDNAALLYYQAFLLRPQPDEGTYLRINAVLRGAAPDRQVRRYLGTCRSLIHTLGIAAQVPQCAWGIRHLDGAGFSEMSLFLQIRQLATVLALDARTLGADGHYEAALARCLTMRRLARHVGEDTMLAYLIALSVDDLARQTMQYILGLLPSDANLLQGLRGQLAAVPGAPLSLQRPMQADFELAIESLRSNTGLLEWVRQNLARNAGEQPAPTDEEVLARTRESYQCFLDSIFRVMDNEATYDHKCAEMNNQANQFADEHGKDSVVSYLMLSTSANTIVERYSLAVRHSAGDNAFKAAVEVYLVRAQTGRLPEVLPEYAPKDPYSDQPFEYEITTGGFLLRCRVQDFYQGKALQYEFAVPDGGNLLH